MKPFVSFILLLTLFEANGLKFLLYSPKSTRSHVLFMNKIGDVLVEGGHDVVIYMPEVEKGFGSALNHKKARVIERDMEFEPLISVDNPMKDEWGISESIFAMWSPLRTFFEQFALSCDHQLGDKKLLDQLRNENFNLLLTEFFDPCGYGISEKIELKKHISLFTTASNPLLSKLGVASAVSFTPGLNAPELPPISFMGRVKAQAFEFFAFPLLYLLAMKPMREVFEKHGIQSNYIELVCESSFWFMNSVAKSQRMPPQTKKAFIEAFKEFPDVNFIWKYESPEDGTIENLSNLYLQKWLPQTEIFGQSKLIAFLSHGGMNSITESTYSGVAVICVPLFTDQPRNCQMMKNKGTAVVIKKDNITRESLIESFRTMINDKSFNQNAKELAQMIADKPMKVDEKVLKYSEFAAKYDVHKHLDISGRHLNFIQFYNIDAIAFIFFSIIITLYIFYKLIRFTIWLILRCLCGKSTKKSKSE